MPENPLLILACSWSKNPDQNPTPSFQPNERRTAIDDLHADLRTSVLDGRNAIKNALDPKSIVPVSALDRYNGGMYRAVRFRQIVAQLVKENKAKVLILSGYYGLVTASEPILKYEKEFSVSHWMRYRLPEAISQLMDAWQISYARAFLNAKGPYREIVDKASLRNTRLSFVKESTDPKHVYPALGDAIVQYAQSEFSEGTLSEFHYPSDVGNLTIATKDV